jgi:hypothetical protein
MDYFHQIVSNNYSTNTPPKIYTNSEIIRNIFLFKYTKQILSEPKFKKEKAFVNKVLNSPKLYHIIKNILLDTLNIDNQTKNTIQQHFELLESVGFNSFAPSKMLKLEIQKTITDKCFSLIQNKYSVKHIVQDQQCTILSFNDNDTTLHSGVKELIQLFNISIFMSYDAFINFDDRYTDAIIYYSDQDICKIYLPYSSNFNYFSQLVNLSTVALKSLYDLINQKYIQKKIELILFLSDSQKRFPSNGNYISDLHVNSGDTIMFETPLIRIYRKEELFKVLIHEIIHCSTFETYYGTCSANYNIIMPNNQKYKLKFNETITETLAELINCSIYSYLNNQKLEDVLKNEKQFGLLQTSKILSHFNFDSVNDFLTSTNKYIIQTTSAFEYHILKTILFLNADLFLGTIVKNRNKNGCQKMFALINKTFKDLQYQKEIKKIMDNLDRQDDNFRMTITELDFNTNQSGGNYNKKYLKYKYKYLKLKKYYQFIFINESG